MLTADFHFDLPETLIAQTPLVERSDSRMLVCDSQKQICCDRIFNQFADLIAPGDLLILNDTRVIPARLYGEKKGTGGRVEVLLERFVSTDRALCQLRASKSAKAGTELLLENSVEAVVIGREGDFYLLELKDQQDFLTVFDQFGSVPLPPYIDRPVDLNDRARYQTVYANMPGAVAAPTAGLHFDTKMLTALIKNGVETAFITLHVGAGTFQPVRVTNPDEHTMHAERVEVGADVCEKIAAARARNANVIAVGTTVVRSLEAASRDGVTEPYSGETSIFIKPGYQFKCVDSLLTNFHLPESTLLMLVCAFGGYDFVMSAYRHAVQSRYRFFSYGDAMFVRPHIESKGLT